MLSLLTAVAILLHTFSAQGFVVTSTTPSSLSLCCKRSLRTVRPMRRRYRHGSLSLLQATSKNSTQAPLRRARTKLGNLIMHLKRWIQRRKRCSVYVIECEDNKFCVGSTKSSKQRLNAHFGKHGGWTRMHKPIRIVSKSRRIPQAYSLGQEAQVTAELMLQYGVNNVRGAMFGETRMYTLDDLAALTGFLGHHNSRNYLEMEQMLRAELPPAPNTIHTENTDDTRKGTVYVLQCQGNKFYVGCTKFRKQRLKEHFTGRGSKWTQMHKPIAIVQEYHGIPLDYCLAKEAQVTAELMLRYGVNNVRGAMFVETRVYSRSDLSALTGFLGHFNNLNYKDIEKKLRMELTGTQKRRKKRASRARRKILSDQSQPKDNL